MTVPARSFTGPLFIVGRPRSGTKLLRSMLNEHPRIAIPVSETNFIPSLVRRFGTSSPLADPARFEEFFDQFRRTVFYRRRAQAGVVLFTDELRRSADLSSWPSVFEAILRHYAPAPASSDVIWGDKSPSYLTDLPLLKRLYPGARVIHIVRDPRDQALSANEAWGKHVLRSAERWRRDVRAARTAGAKLGDDYVEVRFEDLVSQPNQIVERLCRFVGVEHVEGMTSLTTSHEDKGSAVGALQIVAQASGRHTSLLDATTIRRIDEIVAPVAHELGYAPAEPVRFRPLPAWRGALYRVHDGATITKSYFEADGLRHSLAHLWVRARASD